MGTVLLRYFADVISCLFPVQCFDDLLTLYKYTKLHICLLYNTTNTTLRNTTTAVSPLHVTVCAYSLVATSVNAQVAEGQDQHGDKLEWDAVTNCSCTRAQPSPMSLCKLVVIVASYSSREHIHVHNATCTGCVWWWRRAYVQTVYQVYSMYIKYITLHKPNTNTVEMVHGNPHMPTNKRNKKKGWQLQ